MIFKWYTACFMIHTFLAWLFKRTASKAVIPVKTDFQGQFMKEISNWSSLNKSS